MSTKTRFEKEAKGNSEIVYWLNTRVRFGVEIAHAQVTPLQGIFFNTNGSDCYFFTSFC